jgi:hypothetical protein
LRNEFRGVCRQGTEGVEKVYTFSQCRNDYGAGKSSLVRAGDFPGSLDSSGREIFSDFFWDHGKKVYPKEGGNGKKMERSQKRDKMLTLENGSVTFSPIYLAL